MFLLIPNKVNPTNRTSIMRRFETLPAKLTLPYSTHPVAAMKPFLDGVICAFHGEDEEKKTETAVKNRFKKNGLNEQQINKFFKDSKRLFGKHNYLTENS